MNYEIHKMHAHGDHFVLVDARGRIPVVTSSLAVRLGNNRRGIGFNQLCEMTDSSVADVHLQFWNPDGSSLNVCGSATRGVAELLMSEMASKSMTVETAMGILHCQRAPNGSITVNMGQPILNWQDIPLERCVDTLMLPLENSPSACSMGNPHCTFFVNDVSAVDVATKGPILESDPLFPNRTNVHFVEIIDRSNIRLRIWERGGGIPDGSGSCSCAAAVNSIRRGFTDNEVNVHCDGGSFQVRWISDLGVFLTGKVERIFFGQLAAEYLNGGV